MTSKEKIHYEHDWFKKASVLIIEAIKRLEAALRSSGKLDTADFYCDLASQIENEASEQRLKERLQEIKSSGSVIQYADFDKQEEQFWTEMHRIASNALGSM